MGFWRRPVPSDGANQQSRRDAVRATIRQHVKLAADAFGRIVYQQFIDGFCRDAKPLELLCEWLAVCFGHRDGASTAAVSFPLLTIPPC